jgi:osmotically-inducible protein OsmY
MRVVSVLLLVILSGGLQGCVPVVAAGVGAGVMIAQDRRTSDTYINDQKIETSAAQLVEKQVNTVMHVNVTSFDFRVLISGEVPDETTKADIEKMVRGIQNVRTVDNELAVSPVSSMSSRSNDGLITSNVKLRFLNNEHFNSDHIKVVTENGTVYLMGIVNRAEADAATEIASSTQGVQRVVRIFEYLD